MEKLIAFIDDKYEVPGALKYELNSIDQYIEHIEEAMVYIKNFIEIYREKRLEMKQMELFTERSKYEEK